MNTLHIRTDIRELQTKGGFFVRKIIVDYFSSKIYFPPHKKHWAYSKDLIGKGSLGEQQLFIVKITRNTYRPGVA